MNDVAVPAHIYRLAILSLKQYALVMNGMWESASDSESRETFDKARRDIVDVIHLLEGCAP